MPKVRDSSGTIGTMRLPICLSRRSVLRIRTNAIVVEISRPSVALSWPSKADSGGTSSGSDFRRRDGRLPPSAARRSRRYFSSGLSSAKRMNGTSPSCSSEIVRPKRSRNSRSDVLAHLLLLVRDILAFARLAHTVALDCLGEDSGGLHLVLHRRRISRVDLERIVAAADEAPRSGRRTSRLTMALSSGGLPKKCSRT